MPAWGEELKILNGLEQELQEIEKIHIEGKNGENKNKIESFMTKFFLVIEPRVYKVKESPTYQRLSKLYIDDLFILNLDSIIAICKGFIKEMKDT